MVSRSNRHTQQNSRGGSRQGTRRGCNRIEYDDYSMVESSKTRQLAWWSEMGLVACFWVSSLVAQSSKPVRSLAKPSTYLTALRFIEVLSLLSARDLEQRLREWEITHTELESMRREEADQRRMDECVNGPIAAILESKRRSVDQESTIKDQEMARHLAYFQAKKAAREQAERERAEADRFEVTRSAQLRSELEKTVAAKFAAGKFDAGGETALADERQRGRQCRVATEIAENIIAERARSESEMLRLPAIKAKHNAWWAISGKKALNYSPKKKQQGVANQTNGNESGRQKPSGIL